jgi:hypothetical protein
MKQNIKSSQIKAIMYGIIASDGYIDVAHSRLDLYSKRKEYIDYVYSIISEIPESYATIKRIESKYGTTGYRLWTRKHKYFDNLGYAFYCTGTKELNKYNISKMNIESLAHIWMCDGQLDHKKNRIRNTIQNIGYIHFQCFSDEENLLFINHWASKYNIQMSLLKKSNAGGSGNVIRIGGMSLQRLISLIYPYILNCFKYKTPLFYKTKEYVNEELPNAEQYLIYYKDIEDIEDIVRHP